MNDFNILAASIMSGVSVHQIRAWEKRYQAVTPSRLNNNFRSYSQENIVRLKLLGDLTRHGISISKIAQLPTFELQKQFDALGLHHNIKMVDDILGDVNEKFNVLVKLYEAEKYDVVSHEIQKLKTLADVISIVAPMMKHILSQEDSLNNVRIKMVFSVLVDKTQEISLYFQSPELKLG
jgi:DNA-binding transcriptional MerR regulator